MPILPASQQLPSTEEEFRRCSRCKQELPLAMFVPRSDRPGQHHAGCRSCRAAKARANYIPRPAPPRPTEKQCGRCKEVLLLASFPPRSDGTGVRSICRECKCIEKREYNESHSEQRKVYQREYYQANADAIGERVRASIAKNPEHYRSWHSDWKKRNKDAVNASTHKRRARIRHNGGSWTAEDWERLKARYDWRCLMCGKQEMTDGITLCFDHVVPLSLGGLNIISNGQPLCRSCNSLKHRKVKDYRPDFWQLQKVEQQANVAQA